MFFLYSVLFIILFLSFSNPYIYYVEKKHSQPKAVIAFDESKSMNSYDLSFFNNFKSFLKKNNVSFKIVSFKKSYSEIVPFVEENTPIIVVSDDNVKDSLYFKSFSDSLNSSIFLLDLKPKSLDYNVKIVSPSYSFKNNVINVNVSVNSNFKINSKNKNKNNSYILKVYYNNKTLLKKNFNSDTNYSFKLKTKNLGYNVLKAEIIVDDYFKENNFFSKSFYVYNPLEISFFSYHKNSPLKEYLSKVYSVNSFSSLKNFDFKNSGFNNVLVIDDIPYTILKPYILSLSDFVVNGGSIIFFGGKNSFDYDFYENSVLENFLPVKIGSSGKESSDSLNVVFLIDISGSTGQQFSNSSSNSIQDVEKNLVLSAYNSLKDKDKVSIIAFNNFPFVVADMNVKSQQKEVEDRILKLKFFGGTRIKPALKEAVKQLSSVSGKKYVVLFSDGYSYSESEDLNYVLKLKKSGIKLYTVSVGESSNVNFLRQLSKITNAKFFTPSEKSKFKILFENSKSSEDNSSNTLFLSVWDEDHFITKNLYLNSYVKGFNQVFPKNNGRVLIVTSKNNPILTFSYLGLGKILVFSSDNGLYWSGNVFKKNSNLFSKMINFAYGTFKQNNSFYLDSYFSGENNLYFYYDNTDFFNNLYINNSHNSFKLYKFSFDSNTFKLYSVLNPEKVDDNFYKTKIFLSQGKYFFLNKTFIVNYDKEYDYFDSLKKLLNKENVLKYDDYEKILKVIVKNSYLNNKIYEDINNYFLFLAALWYFFILLVRKIFYKE